MEASASIVVADFEAGLGTLSRLPARGLDVMLIVAEPTAKSLEVARRALDMARERGTAGTVLVVANRVRDEDDRRLVEGTFADGVAVVVPDDPALRAADGRGEAPFDSVPDAPAVRAVRALAASLVA